VPSWRTVANREDDVVETSNAAPSPEPAASDHTSHDAPGGAADELSSLVARASEVLIGDADPIATAGAAFVAGGHVLFEDIPGVGKTLLAKTLARLIGGSFGRVQGTPDLLPSDLTGVTVFEEDRREWVFHPGPLFRNVVLVDELNRATPRTQSALLEAMAERQVTVDGVSHELPDPFLVIATQNPQSGDLGTFPLVSGQRDRFAVSLSLGLPNRDDELRVLSGQGGETAMDGLPAVAGLERWRQLRRSLEDVFVHPAVMHYALDVVDVVRQRAGSRQPISTRAALMLLRVARGHALVDGRDHVAPDDVQAVAVAVLAHRIVDATNDDLPTARSWIAEFLRHVPVPPPSSQ
jgi:MoxR-like ATPase